jgi:hypothetical protein
MRNRAVEDRQSIAASGVITDKVAAGATLADLPGMVGGQSGPQALE